MNNQGPKHRILIVDDEEIIRLALKKILERNGFVIDEADTAVDGLAQLERHDYSLVISDQKMPGMSGLEFLAQAKTLCPQSIRILTTVAFNVAAHIDEINRAEVFQFIVKPWESENLLETVHRGIKKFENEFRSESLHESSLAASETLATTALSLENEHEAMQAQIQNLKANWQQTIQINLQTAQTICPWLSTQAQNVRRLCASMASTLELESSEAELLDISAQLYDIGMVSVPPELARRWRKSPDQLTDSEWDIIHQHSSVGANLARFEAPFQGVAELIRCHHERLDGSGFPFGISGDQLPPLAKYLNAAIAIYESPLSARGALSELQRTPERFDLSVLEAIESTLESRDLEFA